MHAKKTAFVVEHDFIMATYLADRVIVYDGRPGVETYARTPQVHTCICFVLYAYINIYCNTDFSLHIRYPYSHTLCTSHSYTDT